MNLIVMRRTFLAFSCCFGMMCLRSEATSSFYFHCYHYHHHWNWNWNWSQFSTKHLPAKIVSILPDLLVITHRRWLLANWRAEWMWHYCWRIKALKTGKTLIDNITWHKLLLMDQTSQFFCVKVNNEKWWLLTQQIQKQWRKRLHCGILARTKSCDWWCYCYY